MQGRAWGGHDGINRAGAGLGPPWRRCNQTNGPTGLMSMLRVLGTVNVLKLLRGGGHQYRRGVTTSSNLYVLCPFIPKDWNDPAERQLFSNDVPALCLLHKAQLPTFHPAPKTIDISAARGLPGCLVSSGSQRRVAHQNSPVPRGLLVPGMLLVRAVLVLCLPPVITPLTCPAGFVRAACRQVSRTLRNSPVVRNPCLEPCRRDIVRPSVPGVLPRPPPRS
jgi:hypothetical protein